MRFEKQLAEGRHWWAQIHYIFKTVISYTNPKLILTNYISFESLHSLV